MCRKLPILALVGVLLGGGASIGQAQAPTAQNSQPSAPKGQQLIRSAIAALEARQSVSARIKLQADLLGRRIVGKGTYVSGPSSSHLVRLELQMLLDEQQVSLEQICDGESLWIRRQMFGKTSLDRVDLAPILDAIRERPPDGGAFAKWLGVGGVERMMRSLESAFRFTSVTPTRLGAIPAFNVTGGWNRHYLAELMPDDAEKIRSGGSIDFAALPMHVPTVVVVTIGKDDHFPYRIDYRRWGPTKLPHHTEAAADGTWSLASMELFDVEFDKPVDSLRFAYNPAGEPHTDRTAEYLDELGIRPAKALDPAAEPQPTTP